ncbi:MAG: hypothetical protein ACUVYA_09720 [Planctomycetota bacterium]
MTRRRFDGRAEFVLLVLFSFAAAASYAAEPSPAAPSAPLVKVSDPGKGERRELRIRLAKGWKEAGVMVSRVEMATESSGIAAPPQKMPAPEVTVRAEVTDVTDDGDFTYTFRFSELELKEEEGVSPVALEAMKSQLESMKGLSGTATVTSRGIVRKADVSPPDSASLRVRQAVESAVQSLKTFSVPLPEEPVGVGAKWEVRQAIESRGLQVTQSTGFELLGMEGDELRLRLTLTSSGRSEVGKAAPALAGRGVSIVSVDLRGSGESVVRLDRVLPEKTELEVKGEYTTKMEIQGQARELSTRMEVSTSVRRLP